MPNRIIKESICYSEDLDKLTPFEETVFYRLMVRVDDYGRLDARPRFLKSMLFVTKQGITEKNIVDAIAKLASLGLVRCYKVDGKPFLVFPKWSSHQRIRNSIEKYPAPQLAASCESLPPESNPNPNPDPDPDPESQSNAHTREGDLDGFSGELGNTVADWLAYKAEKHQQYKPVGRKSLLAEIRHHADTYGEGAVAAIICQSMSSNYQGIVWDKLKSLPLPIKQDTLGVLDTMLSEEGRGT